MKNKRDDLIKRELEFLEQFIIIEDENWLEIKITH